MGDQRVYCRLKEDRDKYIIDKLGKESNRSDVFRTALREYFARRDAPAGDVASILQNEILPLLHEIQRGVTSQPIKTEKPTSKSWPGKSPAGLAALDEMS